jgi:hypothetical protein
MVTMLLVTRALPDPAGKDRQGAYPSSNDQLNQEWVEIANAGAQPASVNGVALSHYTFNVHCQRTGEDLLMSLKGTVQPRHSVRFHTGSGTAWDEGTVRHLYVGRENYAWNNRCGDTAVLRNARGEVLDWASYDPAPPEGVVLNRIPGTNKLSAFASARTA